MKIVTFAATPEGGSKFLRIELPHSQQRDDGQGNTIRHTVPFTAPGVQFVTLPEGMEQDWHNAPARQIVVVLSGVLEVETTDGAVRRWQAGEVLLPADVTGQGHCTRCIGSAVQLLFVPLPAGFEFE